MPAQWKAARSKSTAILMSISTSTAELKEVFGADYQVIIDMIEGNMQSSTVSSSGPSGSNANAPSSNTDPRATTGTPVTNEAASITSGPSLKRKRD